MGNLTAVISADTSGLKRSIEDAKGLLEQYSKTAKTSGGSVNGVLKEQITAYNRVIKTMDRVKSGAMSSAQAEKVLSKEVKELKIQWANLSAEAKNSDFGRSLSNSCTLAEGHLKTLQEQIKQVNSQMSDVGKGKGISMDGLKGSLSESFSALKAGDIGGLTTGLRGVAGSLGVVSAGAAAAAAGVAALGVAAVKAGSAAAEFEVHLDQLQSLTGLDNGAMDSIASGAIEMSKSFDASASEIVDSMKLIGSQAPELLKDKDALMSVTEAANVLAEAAGIGVVDAAKGITTVMNQMGASASEASNIINTLAAGSQQGAADVAYLQTAFEKSGTAAASAGMDYTQLTAVIETVAPKFSSADVAGSQLASTMLALSVQTNDKFKPSVVGLEKALDNLADAQLDDAKLAKLVGSSNITMAKTLMQSRDKVKDFNKSLRDTDTAYKQMEINNDNLEGSIGDLKSAWEAALLEFGRSKPIQGCINLIKKVIGVVKDCINWVVEFFKGFEDASDLNISLAILGQAFKNLWNQIKLIAEVVEVVLLAFRKLYNSTVQIFRAIIEYISGLFKNLVEWFKSTSIGQALANLWTPMYKAFQNMIVNLKNAWKKFKAWLGAQDNGGTKKQKNQDDYRQYLYDRGIITESQAVQVSDWAIEQTMADLEKKDKAKKRDEVKKYEDEHSYLNQWAHLPGYRVTGPVGDYQVAYSEEMGADIPGLYNNNRGPYNNPKKDIREARTYFLASQAVKETKEEPTVDTTVPDVKIPDINTGSKVNYKEGSLGKIEEEISKLQQAYKEATTSDQRKSINEQLRKLQKQKELIELEINPKVNTPEGSLKDLEEQISKKQTELNLSISDEDRARIQKEIEDLTGKKRTIELKLKPVVEDKDLKNLEESLANKPVKKEMSYVPYGEGKEAATATNNADNLKEELDYWRSIVKEQQESYESVQERIKAGATLTSNESKLADIYEQATKKVKELGSAYDVAAKSAEQLNKSSKLKQAQYKGFKKTIGALGDFNNAVESTGSGWSNLVENWEDMSPFEKVTGAIGQTISTIESAISAYESITDIINVFGEISELMSAKKVAANTAEMASDSALTATETANTQTKMANDQAENISEVGKLGVKEAGAIAGATASGASLPFPANIAAIAAGIAAVVAGFAMVFSCFADGGIVGGGNTMGDYQIARVNSGEMILNGTQQKRLFNLLNGTESIGMSSGRGGKVEFTIKGSKLKGVMKNYDAKKSKV